VVSVSDPYGHILGFLDQNVTSNSPEYRLFVVVEK
jgi:hypothetical protein